MTICFVTDGRPGQVGGIAAFNRYAAAAFTDAGHSVLLLCVNSSAKEEVIKEGLITTVVTGKNYTAHYNKWKDHFRPGGFDAPNWIATGMCARDWLLSNHAIYQIDIIEVSDYGGIGIFLCDAMLPPVIITGHGSLSQFSPFNYTGNDANARVVQQLETLSYQHAAAVIVHSRLNKENLQQRFPAIAVKEALISWVHTSDTITETENGTLLTVGGLQPVKGVYPLMDAMQILVKRKKIYPVHWIGGDTWLAKNYGSVAQDLARKYPGIWQQSFQWQQEMPYAEVQRALSMASLIVIPALFETFNYVALEAAALQKAILITEGTGAAAFLEHGHSAWIIPSNDPEALAAAAEYLMENPGLRKELGANADKAIRKQFTPDQIVLSRLNVYRNISGKERGLQNGLHPSLKFLERYRTLPRKLYYCTRRILKKIAGRT